MAEEMRETIYGDFAGHFVRDRLADLCDPTWHTDGPFGSQLHQKDYVSVGTDYHCRAFGETTFSMRAFHVFRSR